MSSQLLPCSSSVFCLHWEVLIGYFSFSPCGASLFPPRAPPHLVPYFLPAPSSDFYHRMLKISSYYTNYPSAELPISHCSNWYNLSHYTASTYQLLIKNWHFSYSTNIWACCQHNTKVLGLHIHDQKFIKMIHSKVQESDTKTNFSFLP